MRKHYDFSKMKGKKNPYAKQLKQPVTMRLDKDTVSYFKSMAEESGIPYQTLINELLSNLVYGLHESGGFPAADFSLVHSIDELHAGDDVGELAKAV